MYTYLRLDKDLQCFSNRKEIAVQRRVVFVVNNRMICYHGGNNLRPVLGSCEEEGKVMIRILLVDDHPSARDGTKSRLEEEPDISVTAVASGMEALEFIQAGERYSIMLFDLHMPVISGLELTRRVMEIHPNAVILIYTGYDILPNFNILIEAGVSGFVSKASSWEYLAQSIRYALQGESLLPTALLKQLRRHDIHFSVQDHEGISETISITKKEQTILQEISLGKSNKEIATLLFMSQRNVEYHLSRIFDKLHVRSRFEAIAEAKKYGLIKSDELL